MPFVIFRTSTVVLSYQEQVKNKMNLARQLMCRAVSYSSISIRHMTKKSGILKISSPQTATHSSHSVLENHHCMTTATIRLSSTTGTAKKIEVINVQDEDDFKKRVLQASKDTPIVVDFHATWCGPCKLLGPRLENIIAEEGKVLMAKVDIDEISELAMQFGVRSVPTVIGVRNGKVFNQFIGLVDDDQIRSFVKKLVCS